uniref:Uncharacterized protein n=1 Tax=Arundo donax TaxID=35708 RepID=A0A0A9BMU4_ARUDO
MVKGWNVTIRVDLYTVFFVKQILKGIC